MTNPPSTCKVIEIETPDYDPTIRKKPRYEHSLSRIIKKNPRVTSTIKNIRSNTNISNMKSTSSCTNVIPTPEPVEKTVNDHDDLVYITDSISNSSSEQPVDITIDTELDRELLSDLTVSDSEDESNPDKALSIVNNSKEITTKNSEQNSINDSSSEISQTDHTSECNSQPIPYVAEPVRPVPSYTPTPKSNIKEPRRRAVKYIPVSEWMFDQWRIISKANQTVGDAMKEAMIQEGLLYARK